MQLIGDHGRELHAFPLLGDRVVVKTVAGELLVGELKRRNAKTLELAALDIGGADRALASDDVEWIARIVWTRH